MTDLRTWDAWRDVHQPWELRWWKEQLAQGHSRDDNGFARFWGEVIGFIRPDGRIIDIGCGPRPPFAPCAVIEPLANAYRELVPASWWEGVEVFAQPAEELIDGLRGDTIICWNCLDHTIGWSMAVRTMHALPSLQIFFSRSSVTQALTATSLWGRLPDDSRSWTAVSRSVDSSRS
jgi:hypothetical protein